YFAIARGQIEAHGGIVEKFIGDAVLGVFGVPKSHEDDPERAIRAALRIAESAADLRSLGDAPLRLRAGVNTGEALVRTAVDLALLTGLFDKAVAADMPQMVSVTGEPGLGKTRIVAELMRHVDEQPGLVTWRQGRCLPYGEGITFWALGEILKAHAGILESDDPATATARLDVVLPEGEERAWFRQRLLPLLGIGASASAEREELFTAWRRFLEHVAEADPTVLVFEDMQWADDALLAFLEHLAGRAEGVPLLIVCTARPELYE